MAKRILTGVLIMTALLSPVSAQAMFSDQEIDSLFLDTQMYFLEEGMTNDAYGDFQKAKGSLKEYKAAVAIEILTSLRKQYPDNVSLALTLAHAFQQNKQHDKALLILEDVHHQIDMTRQDQQDLLWMVIMQKAYSYRAQGQTEQALKLLDNTGLSTTSLSASQKDAMSLLQAELEYSTQQYESAYQKLLRLTEFGSQATAHHARKLIKEWSPILTDKFYRKGMEDYRNGNYVRALKYAFYANKLDPQAIKNSQLVSRIHDDMLKMVQDHFDYALPVLNNTIRNMRYSLADENYRQLYSEYQSLKQDADVAFFMNPDYIVYLPTSAQQAIQEVEDELRRNGYRV